MSNTVNMGNVPIQGNNTTQQGGSDVSLGKTTTQIATIGFQAFSTQIEELRNILWHIQMKMQLIAGLNQDARVDITIQMLQQMKALKEAEKLPTVPEALITKCETLMEHLTSTEHILSQAKVLCEQLTNPTIKLAPYFEKAWSLLTSVRLLIKNTADVGIVQVDRDNAIPQAGRDINVVVIHTPPLSATPFLPTNEKVVFHIPHARNNYFTGREEILCRTCELLAQQQVVALHGLGGIGKTQTAVHYAYVHRNEYTAILWFNAESVAAFNGSLATVARALGIKRQQQDEILKAVTQWLTNKKNAGWLLIADNADDLDIVKNFVSVVKAYGRVLLTTRATATRPIAEPVEIVQMTESEGTRFLYRQRGIAAADCEQQVDYVQACELVRLMDGLPLALEQAAAYIEVNQLTLAEYLTLYQRYVQQLLAERGPPAHDDYPLPVAVTWQASFDKIRAQNPQTLAVLECCALLPGDGIPEEILRQVFAESMPKGLFARLLAYVKRHSTTASLDELQFQQLIKPALAYSLLERGADQRLVSIHHLAQMVSRKVLSEEAQQQWIERLVKIVYELFPRSESIENWPGCQRLVSSVLSCAAGIAKHRVETAIASLLLSQTAYYLIDKADYDTAKQLYKQSLMIDTKIYGNDRSELATNLNNLALLHYAQGEYDQALPLFERSLAIWEQILGPHHPDVAASLNNLALLYKAQGKHDQAKPLYERALTIFERTLGTEHPDVASILKGLAVSYESEGQYTQALSLYERAQTICDKKSCTGCMDSCQTLLEKIENQSSSTAQNTPPISRNAPNTCDSGRRHKHRHGWTSGVEITGAKTPSDSP